MAADFNTYLSIKGTKDELKAVLGVLKKFENDSEIYLQFVEVGKGKENERIGLFDDSTRLRDLSPDDKVEKFLDSVGTELMVTAGGPYGHFGWLEETGLFEAIADAAPGASIEGIISGFSTGADQSVWCKTEDGKLHIFYKYTLDDSDSYSDYVSDILPYAKFKSIFEVDSDDYEDDYYDFIEELIGEGKLFALSFGEFTGMIPMKIEEEVYKKAVERIRELGIKSREEFEEEESGGPDSESIYDPVAKKYLKEGGIYSLFSDGEDSED